MRTRQRLALVVGSGAVRFIGNPGTAPYGTPNSADLPPLTMNHAGDW
jgi:hypothetical protein